MKLGQHIVIVGAGQAGFQCAVSLREAGHNGPISLIGIEPGAPYQRPPLSKAYLLGKVAAENILFRPAKYLTDIRVNYQSGRSVERIDTEHQQLALNQGETLHYDHLVLATGARNRTLNIPGTSSSNVHGLRTLADADALSNALSNSQSPLLIGAGFIGLEFAAVAAAKGKDVTVVDTGERPLAHALSPTTADYIYRQHLTHGVKFHFNTQLATVSTLDNCVNAVALSDGTCLNTDLMVIGIGVIANDELAAEAGLSVDNGILVDALLTTSDPAISAIGDCARHPNPFSPTAHCRIESVQNAVDQAKALASTLTGQALPYNKVPWFWSDQYDWKLQIAGLPQAYDHAVTRTRSDKPGFSVFRFSRERLVTVESILAPADHLLARRVISENLPFTPEMAKNPDIGLKQLAAMT